MIALWILLGLIALILLALCIPVHAKVRYGEQLELDIHYLFLKFPILPEPEKPEAETTEEKTEAKQEKPKEKKPNILVQKTKAFLKAEGFNGFFELLGRLLKLTGTKASRLLKRFRVRDLDLYVMTGGPDAAAAAILYGQVCAAVYPAAEVLLRLVKCRKRRVSVDLDYNVTEPYVKLEADVSVRPIFAVHYALGYVIGVIPMIRRFMNPVNRKNTVNTKR